MRRRFPIALTVIAAAALLLTNGVSRYTHSDLAGRSTEELSREVISLVVDHPDEPFALLWPRLERQRAISEELARRQPKLLARMRLMEDAECASAGSCSLVLAEPPSDEN